MSCADVSHFVYSSESIKVDEKTKEIYLVSEDNKFSEIFSI